MEKKEKNKKNGSTIVILILSILLAICIGYIICDKFVLPDNKPKCIQATDAGNSEEKPETTPVEDTTTDYYLEEARALIQKISASSTDINSIEVFANDKKVEAKNVPSQQAYNIVYFEFYMLDLDTVSLNQMAKRIQKYLGEDYVFNPDEVDYNATCAGYNYDSSTKTYSIRKAVCGYESPPGSSYRVIKAEKNQTDYTLAVTTKVVFLGEDRMFYSDYARTKYIDKTTDNIPDTFFDVGDTYQFNFKMVDNEYVFVSSELVK